MRSLWEKKHSSPVEKEVDALMLPDTCFNNATFPGARLKWLEVTPSGDETQEFHQSQSRDGASWNLRRIEPKEDISDSHEDDEITVLSRILTGLSTAQVCFKLKNALL